MMRILVGGMIVLASFNPLATPALAHTVEITTSVDVTGLEGETAMKGALEKAVDAVLSGGVIAFQPTRIAITAAQMIGPRLYLTLLLTDAEGDQEQVPKRDKP
jgi:hypothetical protein